MGARRVCTRVAAGARGQRGPRPQQAGQGFKIPSGSTQRSARGFRGFVRKGQRGLYLCDPRLSRPTRHGVSLGIPALGVGVDSGQEGVRGEVLFGRDRRPHQFLVGEWLPALPEVILDLPPGLFRPSALEGQTQRDQCRHDHGAQGQRTPPRCPDRPEAGGSQRHGPAIPEQRHQPCGQKERVFQPDMHPFGEGIPSAREAPGHVEQQPGCEAEAETPPEAEPSVFQGEEAKALQEVHRGWMGCGLRFLGRDRCLRIMAGDRPPVSLGKRSGDSTSRRFWFPDTARPVQFADRFPGRDRSPSGLPAKNWELPDELSQP